MNNIELWKLIIENIPTDEDEHIDYKTDMKEIFVGSEDLFLDTIINIGKELEVKTNMSKKDIFSKIENTEQLFLYFVLLKNEKYKNIKIDSWDNKEKYAFVKKLIYDTRKTLNPILEKTLNLNEKKDIVDLIKIKKDLDEIRSYAYEKEVKRYRFMDDLEDELKGITKEFGYNFEEKLQKFEYNFKEIEITNESTTKKNEDEKQHKIEEMLEPKVEKEFEIEEKVEFEEPNQYEEQIEFETEKEPGIIEEIEFETTEEIEFEIDEENKVEGPIIEFIQEKEEVHGEIEFEIENGTEELEFETNDKIEFEIEEDIKIKEPTRYEERIEFEIEEKSEDTKEVEFETNDEVEFEIEEKIEFEISDEIEFEIEEENKINNIIEDKKIEEEIEIKEEEYKFEFENKEPLKELKKEEKLKINDFDFEIGEDTQEEQSGNFDFDFEIGEESEDDEEVNYEEKYSIGNENLNNNYEFEVKQLNKYEEKVKSKNELIDELDFEIGEEIEEENVEEENTYYEDVKNEKEMKINVLDFEIGENEEDKENEETMEYDNNERDIKYYEKIGLNKNLIEINKEDYFSLFISRKPDEERRDIEMIGLKEVKKNNGSIVEYAKEVAKKLKQHKNS